MLKKWHVGLVGLCVVVLVGGGLWPGHQIVTAQEPNLLTNGSLERPYYGQGAATQTAPDGWKLWVGAGAPEAFPHNDRVQVRDGEVSWNVKQGFVAFTAAGYQQVGGLTAGDTVRATAYGWVYTCNNTENSCVIPDPPYRKSDTSAGASLKVGIDPKGGTDPNAAGVQWSGVAAPYDQWAEMSVTATAEGSTVTVFLYMSQSAGLALNNVYWDQVSLVRTEPAPPPATPTPAEVPFVVPQGVRPDGSIVHVVREGDTLSSIAYAYNADYGVTIESIVALNEGLKPNTRFLQLGQEIVILPPGSVDPVTGQLIPPDQRAQATQGATEAATEATEEPAPEATEEAAGAAAATEPAPEATPEAAEAAPEPTEAATEEPTPEATEELTPEATEEPERTAEAVADASAALTATSGTLCVTVYRDDNLNLAREADEPALPGAAITLVQPDSAESTYTTDDTSGPLCLDLLPGRYEVRAALPEGYGMTTADSASVSLVKGHQVSVSFGGAEGYTPPAAPEAEATGETGEEIEPGAVAPMVEVVVDKPEEEEKSALDKLYDNSGLIVLGFAGVIVVSSTVLLFAVRRFTR